MPRYAYEPFAYKTPPELQGGSASDAPVIIVGAGPIGLAAAIDLALHGVKSVLLDDNNVVSVGSRAICWAKRTLEIFDRLGIGDRMLEKGVTWKVGRLFHRDNEVYNFDLLPENGHKMPAFINLQQYYVEQYLVERAEDFADLIDLRWNNTVTAVDQSAESVSVALETPDGPYRIEGAYLLACDGSKSAVRSMLGLDFSGRVFEERFLIADVEMTADFPSERWFWFEPTFHSGESALLHKQPDNIYRIDLQLGWDADPEEEKKPENVIPRIQAIVGERPFDLDWVSVYTFQCRRLERFVHQRILFIGDSAHIVSPFGARGGNGGIQDVDNLIWKLAAVLEGRASAALLESYNDERVFGADENLLNSARATTFMTPKSNMEKLFRASVLNLATDMPFARKLVNSGRLSIPCTLPACGLQTDDTIDHGLRPGAPCLDAPVTHSNGTSDWLLNQLGGRFTLMHIGQPSQRSDIDSLSELTIGISAAEQGDLVDEAGLVTERYGRGLTYLIRPDQHVAARFQGAPGDNELKAAYARATAGGMA